MKAGRLLGITTAACWQECAAADDGYNGGAGMVAYEFYLRNETNEVQLVGILPERRKDRNRISPESILKWGKEVLGSDIDQKDIFYVTMDVDENGGGNSSQSAGF